MRQRTNGSFGRAVNREPSARKAIGPDTWQLWRFLLFCLAVGAVIVFLIVIAIGVGWLATQAIKEIGCL